MGPLFSGCGVRLVGSSVNRLYVIGAAVVRGASSIRAQGLGGLGEGFCFIFSFLPRFAFLDVGGEMNSGVITKMKLGSWVLRRSHLWVSFTLASVVLLFCWHALGEP
jgi:hypothetical protein